MRKFLTSIDATGVTVDGVNVSLATHTHAASAAKQDGVSTISATSGVIAYDYDLANVFVHTASPTADWTVNFTDVPTTNDYATTFSIIVPQATTAYKVSAVQVGGSAQTVRWAAATQPSGSGGGAVSEVQTITLSSYSSSDSYTLQFGGVTSTAITQPNHNLSAATSGSVRYALDQILGSGNWSTNLAASGTPSSSQVYTVTFAGTYVNADVALITAPTQTGCTVTIAETTKGVTQYTDIWTFTLLRRSSAWTVYGTMSAGYGG